MKAGQEWTGIIKPYPEHGWTSREIRKQQKRHDKAVEMVLKTGIKAKEFEFKQNKDRETNFRIVF